MDLLLGEEIEFSGGRLQDPLVPRDMVFSGSLNDNGQVGLAPGRNALVEEFKYCLPHQVCT